MIQPIPRTEIFRKYHHITGEVSRIQKEMFDVDELAFIDDDNLKSKYVQSYDAILFPESTLATYYKVISFRHSNLGTYTAELAKRLDLLMNSLTITPRFILAHLKCSMPNNRNLLAPINERKRLSSLLPPTDFENAFLFGPDDFPILIDLVFRLIRSDPDTPEYIFFCDEQDTFAFFLCRYGNVHTVEFGNEILTAQVLNEGQWFEVKSRCYEKFSE